MYTTTASARFETSTGAGRRVAVLAWLRRMFELSGSPYAEGLTPPL
jgi:hypothetical protein